MREDTALLLAGFLTQVPTAMEITVKGTRWILQVVWYQVPGRQTGHKKGTMTEHRTAVSQYKQLMASLIKVITNANPAGYKSLNH